MSKEKTYTREEVEAWLDSKLKESKMGDDEKRIRGIVREEVGEALKAWATEFFEFGEGGGEGEGKGEGKRSLIDSFFGDKGGE